ncbi:MAG: putative RND superfamily exporter protein [Lentisphaeria bacterium]
MKKLPEFVVKNPIKIILFSLVFILVSSIGFRFFYIETDYEVFFDGENERLKAHLTLEREYGRKDGIRVGIAPQRGGVFDAENLAIIEEITEAFWQIPYSNRVESLTNFQYARDIEGELETSDLFKDSLNLSAAQLQERKDYALSEPAVVNISVNPKGTFTGIIAYVTLPEGNPRATGEIVAATEEILAVFTDKYPHIEFHITGSVPTNFAFFKASTKGMATLILLMIVLGLSLLAYLQRSWSAIIATFSVIIGAAVIGLGLASWLRLPFTAFSSNAILIIITVVIANTVHIIALIKKGMRDGLDKKPAIVNSLQRNLKPVFLTTLTTAIGLLCLNFSDIPPSRFLGITSALGVVGAFILTYSMLPAILSLLPMNAKSAASGVNDAIWENLSDYVLGKKKLITPVLLILIVGTVSFIPQNEVNDSILTYFDEDVKFRSDTDYLVENLFFYYTLDISIPSGRENGINSPEYMENIGHFLEWLELQPEVYSVITFAHTMKNLNRSMHDGDQQWWKLPQNTELSTQYLLLYEMSLPFGFDMGNLVNVDKSASKMIVGLHDLDSKQLIAFDLRLEEWMANHFPPVMQTKAGGASIMFANIWGDAAASNIVGMLIAVVVISIIIAVAMGSFSLGALSLLPNLLPGLMAFGLWGLIDGRIDMGASVVAIITFGIVVDDTIHFISKFQYAFQELKHNAEQSVRYAMSNVAEAISTTTVVLVCGFAILAQSSFTLTGNMGKLTCILLVFALILDLLLLPNLLLFIYRNKGSKQQENKNIGIDVAIAMPSTK